LPVQQARLRVTAHGLAEVELNGDRVGREELLPGWTPYHERLRVHTFDVTAQLRPGRNAIGAWLADGWFRGRFGFEGGTWNIYGEHVGLFAQLEVTTEAGTEVITTGPQWRSAPGPLTRASLYDGETYDARLHPAGLSEPGFDDADWHGVEIHELDRAVLSAPDGPPVRCTEELAPVEVTRLREGTYLLDFGQNHSGRLRLQVPAAEPGHEIRVRHAEVLQDGELYTRTLRDAAATDELLSTGEAMRWEPRFTIHGYRFAEVSGWPGELAEGAVVSRVLHSDMQRTGWFRSSDPLLDRLHENVVWSLRSNFVDIPTDCPQRDERLAWTGDIQVFTPTAGFLYDVHGFLADWLRTLSSEQARLGGTAPVYAPWIPGGRFWREDQDIAGWGDAATLTPWALFEDSADAGLLARQYAGAKAWVDKVAAAAGPTRLWDEGLQLGDWLDPSAPRRTAFEGVPTFDHDPDAVLTGGLVANVVAVAKDIDIGKASEDFIYKKNFGDCIERAREILDAYSDKIVVPEDFAYVEDGVRHEVSVGEIPQDKLLIDIGHKTIDRYVNIIHQAGTVFMNGPMGVFEKELSDLGTKAVWEAAANTKGFSVIGGGDSIAAANLFGVSERLGYVCTGGGALVRFLSGEELPVVKALKDAARKGIVHKTAENARHRQDG